MLISLQGIRYNTVSLLAGFERFFARRGRPRIIWVDAGTNLGGASKELEGGNLGKELAALENEYKKILFRKALPKHHAGVGAVERVIGHLKNGIMINMKGPAPSTMGQEEFHTWLAKVEDMANSRPLVMGLPIGITLTPNDLLKGRQEDFQGSWEGGSKVARQMHRIQHNLRLFYETWSGEMMRRNRPVKNRTANKEICMGDIVLVKGEVKERMILGRVVEVHEDRNGSVFSATVEYRRSVGGRMIRVSRHLNDLARFMKREEVELEDAAEQIMAGTEDAAGGNLPANDQAGEVQDEIQGEGDGAEEVHD